MLRRRLIALICLALPTLSLVSPAMADFEEIARFNRITLGTTQPVGGCVPDKDIHIQQPFGQWMVCSQDALNFSPMGAPPGGVTPAIGGIFHTPAGVDSIHYNTQLLTNTCGLLGSVGRVDIIAGPEGQTCILPDASLLTSPDYSVTVIDDNLLTMAPTGSNTINGVNAPLGPIRGPLGRFHCELRNVAWYCAVTSAAGLGEVVTSHAHIINETKTNNTTSDQGFVAAYTIPADFFKAGKALCLTMVSKYVTDAGPSTLKLSFKLGATAAYAPPAVFTPAASTTAVLAPRWCMYGTADPGDAVGVLVAPMMQTSSLVDINVVSQPVTLATNGALAINPVILYNTSTGGESFTILHATIEELH